MTRNMNHLQKIKFWKGKEYKVNEEPIFPTAPEKEELPQKKV